AGHGESAPDSAGTRFCWRRAQRQVKARATSKRAGSAHHRRGLQEEEEATASAGPPQPQGPSPQAKTGCAQDNAQPTAAANDTVNRLVLMGRNLALGDRAVKAHDLVGWTFRAATRPWTACAALVVGSGAVPLWSAWYTPS